MSQQLWEFELLLGLAWADGVFDSSERGLLADWAASLPSPAERQQALEWLEHPGKPEELLANAPDPGWTSQSRGFQLLAHCVVVAASDGEIDSQELEFLVHLGSIFRFERDFVELLVNERRKSHGDL